MSLTARGFLKEEVSVQYAYVLKGYKHAEHELVTVRLRLPDSRLVHTTVFRLEDGRIRCIKPDVAKEVSSDLDRWGLTLPFAGESQWISTRDDDGNIFCNGKQIGDADGNIYEDGFRVPDAEQLAQLRKEVKALRSEKERLRSRLEESEVKRLNEMPKWKQTMRVVIELMDSFMWDRYYFTDEGMALYCRLVGATKEQVDDYEYDYFDRDWNDPDLWQRVWDEFGLSELANTQRPGGLQ